MDLELIGPRQEDLAFVTASGCCDRSWAPPFLFPCRSCDCFGGSSAESCQGFADIFMGLRICLIYIVSGLRRGLSAVLSWVYEPKISPRKVPYVVVDNQILQCKFLALYLFS